MNFQAAEDLNRTDCVCDLSNKAELRLVDGFKPSVPRLSDADPLKDEKIRWVAANIKFAYIDLAERYDAEGMAATFDAQRGLNPDFDSRFHPERVTSSLSPTESMEKSGVPYNVSQAAIRLDPPDCVTRYAREISGAHGPSCWLMGGASATVAACWILGRSDSGQYVDAVAMVLDMHGRGRFGEDGTAALARPLMTPRILVLDGLDAAHLDGAAAVLMYPVLRARHMNGHPTIVTSAASIDEVQRGILARCRSEDERQAALGMMTEMVASMGTTTAERTSHTFAI